MGTHTDTNDIPAALYDTACTFCNGEYDERRPPKLVPTTSSVYGHQACINASTIGMRAVSVVQEPAPGSVEHHLVTARDHLDRSLEFIKVSQVELAGEVLQAQTAINEGLAELRGITTCVTGA